MKKKNIKALLMFSGGLDSLLTAAVLRRQDIALECLHFSGPFHSSKLKIEEEKSRKLEQDFGFKYTDMPIEEDFIQLLRNPKYGYGRNLNPCIDCRIYILKRAKDYMAVSGASFIATGEVVGQRPMSQRKEMMRMIEKRSGLEGFLLRPLSAKLLAPTIPEEKGWVDRESLYGIQGRGRKEQMALAAEFGITDYPNPAGGCLLTDPKFSDRLKDLLKDEDVALDDIALLKVGRHFRLSPKTRAIVGRNKGENAILSEAARPEDALVKMKEIPGPLTLIRGKIDEETINAAGRLTQRYAKIKGTPVPRSLGAGGFHLVKSPYSATGYNRRWTSF